MELKLDDDFMPHSAIIYNAHRFEQHIFDVMEEHFSPSGLSEDMYQYCDISLDCDGSPNITKMYNLNVDSWKNRLGVWPNKGYISTYTAEDYLEQAEARRDRIKPIMDAVVFQIRKDVETSKCEFVLLTSVY